MPTVTDQQKHDHSINLLEARVPATYPWQGDEDPRHALEMEYARINIYQIPKERYSDAVLTMRDHRASDTSLLKEIAHVRGLINEFQDSEIYREALRAWRNDDAVELRRLLPQVFQNLKEAEEPAFYHGIDPKPLGVDHLSFSYAGGDFFRPFRAVPVTEYIERIVTLKEDGLRPSAKWMDFSADENLRGVYLSDRVDDSYGLIRFEVTPELLNGRTVYHIDGGDWSWVVHTPRLRVDKIFLVNKEEEMAAIRRDIRESDQAIHRVRVQKNKGGMTADQLEEDLDKLLGEYQARLEYLQEVKKELLQLKIPFVEKGAADRAW